MSGGVCTCGVRAPLKGLIKLIILEKFIYDDENTELGIG